MERILEITTEQLLALIIDNYNMVQSEGKTVVKYHDSENPQYVSVTFLDSNEDEVEVLNIEKIFYKNRLRPILNRMGLKEFYANL